VNCHQRRTGNQHSLYPPRRLQDTTLPPHPSTILPDVEAALLAMQHNEPPRSRPGKSGLVNYRAPPLYSRDPLPPLPYDIDGVSPTEQSEILSSLEKLRLDSGVSNLAACPNPPSGATIEMSPDYMASLANFVLSQDILHGSGYVLKELSTEDLERKKKCAACRKCGYIQPKLCIM
jgi:hypothetical protein